MARYKHFSKAGKWKGQAVYLAIFSMEQPNSAKNVQKKIDRVYTCVAIIYVYQLGTGGRTQEAEPVLPSYK